MTKKFYITFLLAAVFNASTGSPWQRDVSIVGGDEVDITQYPYQVLIQNDGHPWCGGSIISDEYILTAAHCIHGNPTESLSVRIGTSYSTKGGQIFNVKTKFVHPKFDGLAYDFSVLQMAAKLPINNETTKIVKLADSGSSLNPGDNIVVTGWGDIQEGGPPSPVLRAVTVPMVSLESCQKMYDKGLVTKTMLCAGPPEGGKDACQGDSGGPAVSQDDLVQYGIVSWGYGCAQAGHPGVYAHIPIERDWIRKVSGV